MGRPASFATIPAMVDTFLVPQKTVIQAKGDGVSVDVSSASNRVLLATLHITNIIEQESLDVSIYGSADGTTWTPKPLASFPQKFYRGEHPLLLDLTRQSEVKFLRAHWEVNRWGRGPATPMFQFHVVLKEVSAELLKEIPWNSDGRNPEWELVPPPTPPPPNTTNEGRFSFSVPRP